MNPNSQTTGFEIAVIGMACRFPGAKNIYEFWNNLKNGVESVTFLADEELKEAGLDEELVNNPNYVKTCGGILENKDYFDASFFGYTPTEAEIMDPQMRIFHECVWEALEDAAYDPFSYEGAIGLYAGATSRMSWEALATVSGKADAIGGFTASHLIGKDFMNTRISYKLNLKGPVITVQTACSTSLVAIHMACRALLTGECDMALAGGVTVTVKDNIGYLYKKGFVKSPDGHCRAFDADAAGFVGGSGAGAVVLKRLKYAAADNDHIYAVIKGSSINNDGARKVGYTAPSIEGQVGVIKTALHLSRVEPESITYMETHGTATPLGDPVEVEALKQAFTPTSQKHLCGIGSVKTNVGHLDSAAGAAGFIKTVLALKYRMIPPSLNFKTPNPKIDFKNTPFFVNDRLKEWKNDHYPLRAGVSAFGIGGTNAHVILEEWSDDHSPGARPMEHGPRSHLILLSAKTETALDKMTENLADHFKQNPAIDLADAAYTLQVGRRPFKYRRKWVCSSFAEAVEALSPDHTGKPRAFAAGDEESPVIFMFSGFGAQYVNMGRDLYEKETLFRQEMDHCFDILKPIMGYDIKEILYPPATGSSQLAASTQRINQLEISQLVIFIFEYSLAKLVMKWGIRPNAMIGYSIGEYTAACLSGVFSLEDALKLVAARMELVQQTPEGKMLSVPLPENELKPLLTDELFIAIDNGASCIITGPAAAVDACEKQMKAKRYLCMPLQVNCAAHSKMMAPILKEFEAEVRRVRFSKPRVPYISNVTGTWIKVDDASDPRYWARHLGETVRFADGIKELAKEKNAIFVEVGPARDLNALVRRFIQDNPLQHITNLVRHPGTNISDHVYLLNKIGELWLHGKTIDRTEFHKEEKRYRIPLPTYPFEGKPYWIEGDIASYAKKGSLPTTTSLKKETDLSRWFYLPLWKQAPLLPKERKPFTGTGEPGSWLVFADSGGPGLLPGERLKKAGFTVITVTPGPAFEKQNNTAYTIDPSVSSHYHDLVKALKTAAEFPGRILHLWGMTSHNGTGTTGIETIKETLDTGFYSLVYLVQAIQREKVSGDIKIDVITTDMQEIDGCENMNPAKAAILGPVKVIPQECSNIRCRSIDISLQASRHSHETVWVDQLLEEFASGSRATIIGYRGRCRWERTFEPVLLDKELEDASPLEEGGVYLITGGLGNIGFILAQYLAKHYRARLILTGRTPVPPAHEWDRWLDAHKDDEADPVGLKIKKIKNLEDLGADVLFFNADVADPEAMGDVIHRAEACFGKINGVVHMAGLVGEDSVHLVSDSGKTQCEAQFQSKVYGLPVLEQLFRDRDLDFCWLMSSIASVLGGLRFAAYSAANNFMDAFVNRHNRTGRRWITVNWDNMKPAETAAAFRRILAMETIDRVVVSTGRNLQARIDRWIKLENLRQEDETTAEAQKIFLPRPDILTPYVAPRNEDEQALADIFRELFGFEEIGTNDDFFELGGDSLKAITVIYRIHKKLDVEIPLPEFFKKRTVEKLAEYIKKGEKETYTAVKPVEKKEYYPLSSAQKRLYILQQLERENTVYNMVSFLTVEGSLEKETFESSFKKLLNRHENLRTSLRLIGGEPVQEIHDKVEFDIEYNNMTHSAPAAKTIGNLVHPFDLSKPPLLRVALIKLDEKKHILMLDMHHAISDGVSTDIFVKDFIAMVRGEEPPALKLQYKDYAQWQTTEKERERIKQQEDYWLKEFEGEIPVLNLPTDYPRPAIRVFEGSAVSFGISGEETAAFNQITLEQGVTSFMLILAVTNIFLSKLSSQEDIVIGTPIAGRRHTDLEQVMGMFVNTLALRNHPKGDKPFKAFLKSLKEKTLDALENQDYPFEDLVEQAAVTRDMSRNPLFDVMFVMQNVEFGKIEIPGLQLMPYRYENPTTKFDLTLSCTEVGGRLFFRFDFCTKLFKKETIEKFMSYFKELFFSILDNTGKTIGEYEIITTGEKRRLLFDFNNTAAGYPKNKTIHRLFEEQAGRAGDRVAVIGMEGTGKIETPHAVTFRQLNEQSNRLALRLKEKGVQPDTIVGIMAERSLKMIKGIFGILKASGAYLPIDPGYPGERKQYILEDSNAKVLLTSRDLSERIAFKKEIIYFEDDKEKEGIHHSSDQFITHHSGHLAYIIYTSGSTGRPKGVMIQHHSLVNRLNWMQKKYPLEKNDTILHKTPFTFDVSVWEIFWWAITGARVCLLEPGGEKDPRQIVDAIYYHWVTVMHFVPSMLRAFLEYLEESGDVKKPGSLKQVIASGEALTIPLVKQFNRLLFEANQTALANLYGPTEAAIDVSFYDCPGGENMERIPIGKPIDNIQLVVVQRNLGLQPVGVPGELGIAGVGLARGYLNQPELTTEKFDRDFQDDRDDRDEKGIDKNPLTSLPLYPSTPLYRTGDLARWLPDGNIDFLGRIDHQVKIRGFRIEPGEIEKSLRDHKHIREAVVIDRGTSGDKYLCAFITPVSPGGKAPTVKQLRRCLSNTLPDYMIPSFFVFMDKMPLTASGKIDRKSLPEPGAIDTIGKYIPPRGALEKKLAEIWSGVLGVKKENISMDANFFELGGHSLKAAALVSKIHKELDAILPLAQVFKTPGIKALAEYLKEAVEDKYIAIEPVEKKEYYVLSSVQTRLYVLQQLELESTGYNIPRIIGLQKKPGKARMTKAFKTLIRRHDSYRTSFVMVDEEPVQRIHDDAAFEIECFDLTGNKARVEVEGKVKEGNPHLPRYLIKNVIRPFDLSRAPLLRVGLIKLEKNKYMLIIDMHHIITDEISTSILEREFFEIYEKRSLPALKLQYRDYTEWQNSEAIKAGVMKQENYWLSQFGEEIPLLNLPTDNERPIVQRFEGSGIKFSVGEEESNTLNTFARKNDFTLHMILLALFNIFLYKVSGTDDIIVGIPVAGRRHEDLGKIIGMFVNTLAVRNYLSPEKAVYRFVEEVKEKTLKALENQEYPFEELVEKAPVRRDTSRNPLFDVMFVLHNRNQRMGDALEKVIFEGESLYDGIPTTSKFDLSLHAFEAENRLVFFIEYSTNLFGKETIQRFIGYFKRVLTAAARFPGQEISNIEILDEKEKAEMIRLSNGPKEAVNTGETIHSLFEEKAKTLPYHAAVVFGDELLSYGMLNERANRLAGTLRSHDVKQDTVVAFMVSRSIEMVIGMLAIMKAGGAYLPVDSDYPPDRKKYMLKNSQVDLLLTDLDRAQIDDIAPAALNLRVMDLTDERIYSGKRENPEIINTGSDLIYVIYTSGSTGQPKGVMLEHRNLVNLLKYQYKYTTIDCSSILQFASISFDVSFQEVFSVLLAGGRLYLIDEKMRIDIPGLFKYIERNQIKTLFLPVSFLKTVFSEEDYIRCIPGCIRHIQAAGEQLVVNRRFRNYLRENQVYLHNHYGPSETHVVTTLTLAPSGDIPHLPPIGKPISNTGIYIVDKAMHLVPGGTAGQLCIAGIQVGRGYLEKEVLTSEKFVPGTVLEGERWYLSGDLARWMPDGSIEFLGRIDHQVKLRGFRVEIGEIESHLVNHKAIKEAVVTTVEKNEDKYLCAYIVSSQTPPDALELKEYLSRELPGYMIPTYVVQLEKIPLTPNGKVNRKALPRADTEMVHDHAGPQNPIEEKLIHLWSDILGIDRDTLGLDADFFDLGGHSLKAAVLVSKIHKVFDVKVELVEIFKLSSIKELAKRIERAKKERYAPIETTEKREYYRLSSAQKRLYILQQMEPGSSGYNIPSILSLEGDVKKKKFEAAFRKLILRHESLRTSFRMVGGEPVQCIHDHVTFEIKSMNPGAGETGETSHAPQDMPIASSIKAFVHPFDLSKAPLIRVGLIKIDEKRYLLAVDMHHIVSDGISQGILNRDFMRLYAGETLPPLRLQYKDYSQWQQNQEVRDTFKQQENYWTQVFRGDIPVLDISTDYPRPLIQSFEGSLITFELSREQTGKINKISTKEGITVFMFLLAVFNIFLSKISSQQDIVVGTSIAGRRHSDLEPIIGMFVNTLALRHYPSGRETFTNFLREVRQKTVEAFENQEYPFEELVEKVDVERDMGRNPLFDVMFEMQTIDEAPQDILKEKEAIESVTIKPYQFETGTSKFDLSLSAVETGEKLRPGLEYCTKLFRKETIERFIHYFKEVISSVINNPGKKIAEIEIIPEDEKKQILYEFNNTDAGYPGTGPIHALFEKHASKAGDRVAVIGMDHAVTYRELNEKANQLAALLKTLGIGGDRLVGILQERSVSMVESILAVWKSGGAYIPIDPQYPIRRTIGILDDSGAGVLITRSEYPEPALEQAYHGKIINLETTSPLGPLTNPGINIDINTLAYVIYTSGSTGKPKGAMVEHIGMLNHIQAKIHDLQLTDRSIVAQNASFTFDISVWQFFTALTVGGRTVIYPDDVIMQIHQFISRIAANRITILEVVPSFLPVMLDALNTVGQGHLLPLPMNYLLVTGEEIKPNLVKKWFAAYPHIKMVNAYGPTEASDDITHYVMDKTPERERIPIGKPLRNLGIYIVDQYMNLCPVGIKGEICVSGIGVGRGYLKDEERTRQAFMEDPFTQKKGVRLYKTGDLGAWLPDGSIEFLGRKDYQVKIRGFRIELGEIENRLLNHEKIKEAVVIDKEDERGNKFLCAYITARSMEHGPGSDSMTRHAVPPGKELREYLSQTLPDYMIPGYYVKMDHIPLTSNGKTDRNALPEPEIDGGDRFTPPGNEVEKKLAAIWSEKLEIDKTKIDIDTSFFELGGNSIKVMMLAADIFKIFHVEMTVVQLFNNPKIKQIAEYILEKKKNKGFEAYEEEPFVCFNPTKPKKIFFFPAILGYGIGYKDLVDFIDDYAVYAFNFIEDTDVMKAYVKLITGIQKSGPYLLFGYSSGGNLAFEVVKEMEKQGRDVSDIIILDSYRKVTPFLYGESREWEQQYFYKKTLQMESLGIGFLKEKMVKKANKYARCSEKIRNFGIIKANIHLIRSENPDQLKHDWENASSSRYFTYKGFGIHMNMLNPGYVEKNAEIINKILEKIEYRV
jgi:tyrocidine synthetase-3